MKYSEKELLVIDVAEKLFAEKGFEGTSVRDIAREANGNVSMVSYYFGSKENLLQAVVERKHEDIKGHILNIINNNDFTHLQKMNVVIDEVLDNLIDHQNFHKLLVREEMLNRDGKTYAMLHSFKQKNLAMIEQIIQGGIDSGEFKSNVNVALLMATLVGTVSQLIISKDFYGGSCGLKMAEEGGANQQVKQKLSEYLKKLFKVLLAAEM
jgi:AcrR family transcriptional regulator